MKKCTKCGVEKDRSFFCKKNATRDKLSPHCKTCGSAYSLKWRTEHPIVAKNSMRGYVLRKYSINEVTHNNMLNNQKGLCKICSKTNYNNKMLSIDHDHKTGVVRGLLCSKCNLALGGFCDSPDLLEKAINYLKGG